MPANRFAFAIRVGRQDKAIRLFRLVGNRLQLFCLIGIIVPQHFKAIIGVNRTVFGR